MIPRVHLNYLICIVLCCGCIYGGQYYFIHFHVHTILSSSMNPAIQPGSIVLSHEVPTSHYHVHDIITFQVPGSTRAFVTHRVSKIQLANSRTPEEFFTKGDANSNGDSWVLTAGNIQGKVVIIIPFLGFVLYWAHQPVVVIILFILTFFWLVVPFVLNWLRPS